MADLNYFMFSKSACPPFRPDVSEDIMSARRPLTFFGPKGRIVNDLYRLMMTDD